MYITENQHKLKHGDFEDHFFVSWGWCHVPILVFGGCSRNIPCLLLFATILASLCYPVRNGRKKHQPNNDQNKNPAHEMEESLSFIACKLFFSNFHSFHAFHQFTDFGFVNFPVLWIYFPWQQWTSRVSTYRPIDQVELKLCYSKKRHWCKNQISWNLVMLTSVFTCV